MKKVILVSALILSIGATIFISCSKEKNHVDPKATTNESSASSSTNARANNAANAYTIFSGINNSSTAGYRMNVVVQNGEARVVTAYQGNLGFTPGVAFDMGELDVPTYLGNDSLIIEGDNQEQFNMHPLTLPNDGKKYWLVPFDPLEIPSIIVGGGVYVGCKCSGTWGQGCYLSGSNCYTKVCNSCQRIIIRGGSNPQLERTILFDKGYAVIQADEIVFNNKKYN